MKPHQNKFTKQKASFGITAVIIGCIAILLMSVLLSLNTGYRKMLPSDILHILLGQGKSDEALIVLSFRLPRIILAILVGIGLAVSGAILQGVTRTPLADPGLLGVNSGAGLMIVLYVVLGGRQFAFSIITLPALALVGAIIAAMLVYSLAYEKGKSSTPFRIIMTGIAVQAGLSALNTLLVIKLDDTQYGFVSSWQIGSIWSANWVSVLALLPWICVFLPVAYSKTRMLDILALDDETSSGLGVAVSKERRTLLFIAVALAGASVSVSGSISFVGLIAPHIARRLAGPRHSVLLPVCALLGAILVLTSDTIARWVIEPSSLPTGVVVSIIGAPYFIYLLSRREKETRR